MRAKHEKFTSISARSFIAGWHEVSRRKLLNCQRTRCTVALSTIAHFGGEPSIDFWTPPLQGAVVLFQADGYRRPSGRCGPFGVGIPAMDDTQPLWFSRA